MDEFPAIDVNVKSGNEKFLRNGMPLSIDLLSFWKWSSSDLMGNTMRGVLAEFIVASAIGPVEGLRIEWDAYDIKTDEGLKIEVKSSAYIQSWSQKTPSTIRFDIKPTEGWDAETNETSTEVKRQSDVYVFCVLAHKNKNTIDPLNLDQWDFYIMATDDLNRSVAVQKSIGMSRLKQLGAIEVDYEDIGITIQTVASPSP